MNSLVVVYAFISFVLRVAIDLLNIIRDCFLVVHEKAVHSMEAMANQLDEDELIPSLKFLLFNTDNPTEFVPPSLELVESICSPYTSLIDPVFHGLENIPNDKPVLFIGNHARFAIEYPLLLSKIYQEKGYLIRAAGDYLHKYFPHWPFFKFFGAFDGSKEACIKLMKAKKNLLIFPGGGREVLRRKTDKNYELMWKDRRGFAKLAIQFGYTIVPFASYGSEEMVGVLFDIPLTSILRREMYLPIPVPPTPDRLQRIYFSFGKPISTDDIAGKQEDDEIVKSIRDQAKEGVLEQLRLLKEVQESDPDSKRLPHLLKKTKLF